MSKLVLNDYNMYNPKIKEDRDIVFIGDIHSDVEKLADIKDVLEELKTSILLIGGDLIDSTHDPRNADIVELSNEIAKTTRIIMVKGNHDNVYYGKDEYGKRKEFPSKDDLLFRELNTNRNITVFDNLIEAVPLYDDLRVSGVTLPIEYYENGEKEEVFDNIVMNDLHTNIKRFNIMMMHSLKNMVKNQTNKDLVIKDYLGYISQMNILLGAHIHAGLMPICARGKNMHRGLVGSYATLFPKYAYGIINDGERSALVTGGVTKIAASNEIGFVGNSANKLLAGEIELIHLKHGDENHLELNKRIKL